VNRRAFIAGLGSVVVWPLMARAQRRTTKAWRIGLLSATSSKPFAELYGAFLQGMTAYGYLEGNDFIGEPHYAEGHYERFPELAAELVRQKIDIIVTASHVAVRALQQVTSTIPIVLAGVADPIGLGEVASLARPGSNITGLANSFDDTASKQLELLALAIRNPSRIGLLVNIENPSIPAVQASTQAAARKAGLSTTVREARNLDEVADAFATFDKEGVQGVVVLADAVLFGLRQRLVEIAFEHRMPTIFTQREFAVAGGLMSYGDDQKEFWRRSAAFVDKIMKGAKPAELPVEQPTRFHFTINRKVADALGVTIPSVLYIFADEVIE
jgi:putative ABC transport system substrate-binding protein